MKDFALLVIRAVLQEWSFGYYSGGVAKIIFKRARTLETLAQAVSL
jgi:hypothetical protein